MILRSIFFAALLCPMLSAEHSYGYAFLAPGSEIESGRTNSYLHAGVGGEFGLPLGFGVGGEVGVVGQRAFGPTFALVSANLSYHLPLKLPRIDPFATGGPTFIAGGGAASLYNVGGGVNFWFLPKIGARFEIRDHVWNSESRQFLDYRFGITFR